MAFWLARMIHNIGRQKIVDYKEFIVAVLDVPLCLLRKRLSNFAQLHLLLRSRHEVGYGESCLCHSEDQQSAWRFGVAFWIYLLSWLSTLLIQYYSKIPYTGYFFGWCFFPQCLFVGLLSYIYGITKHVQSLSNCLKDELPYVLRNETRFGPNTSFVWAYITRNSSSVGSLVAAGRAVTAIAKQRWIRHLTIILRVVLVGRIHHAFIVPAIKKDEYIRSLNFFLSFWTILPRVAANWGGSCVSIHPRTKDCSKNLFFSICWSLNHLKNRSNASEFPFSFENIF